MAMDVTRSTGSQGWIQKGPTLLHQLRNGCDQEHPKFVGKNGNTMCQWESCLFCVGPIDTIQSASLLCCLWTTLRVHKWHRRVACLLEENCILLLRGYACRHQVKAVLVGCGKTYHSWEIHSQLTPKLQRAFPFILFQRSALHKQVLRLVLTGLSKGVSMSATAEQMASLNEGRYNEVVFHADAHGHGVQYVG